MSPSPSLSLSLSLSLSICLFLSVSVYNSVCMYVCACVSLFFCFLNWLPYGEIKFIYISRVRLHSQRNGQFTPPDPGDATEQSCHVGSDGVNWVLQTYTQL